MDFFKNFGSGYTTIAAGVGLIGLAVYQFSQGEVELAGRSLMEGLGLLGLRRAIALVPEKTVGPKEAAKVERIIAKS